MELKINAIYKKKLGFINVKILKITTKTVQYAIIDGSDDLPDYRLSINNFIKYYGEV